MLPPNRKRIIFLDMMRALAVLMMVEGHTIDAFLADQYRNLDFPGYFIWNSIRGFTAPIFMFTSGVAFTYLLRSYNKPFIQNPRVQKGFFRFLTLVLIGYLLRYPTYTFFNFTTVRQDQWLTFFTVDALHLIGFGLLFILILSYLGEKLKIKDFYIFGAAALFFFLMFLVTEDIKWTNFMPTPFAAYFYHGTGSLFPFFPWAGYVICGAILGSYLAHNPQAFTTKKFSYNLLFTGISFLVLAGIFEFIESSFYDGNAAWTDKLFIISLRVGGVIVLNAIMSLIALRLKSIPDLVKQVGRHTLVIYAVHVVIIYGSAWIPGIDLLLHRQMDIIQSVFSAVTMIVLMVGMVIMLEKYKSWKKNRLAPAEI